jgi:hypothetical protein
VGAAVALDLEVSTVVLAAEVQVDVYTKKQFFQLVLLVL